MLDRSLVESDRPVRVVLAYRRADEKAAGQLDIHGNFVANIQLVGKAALVIGIVNHIIVQTAVGGHGVYALSAVQVCQHSGYPIPHPEAASHKEEYWCFPYFAVPSPWR